MTTHIASQVRQLQKIVADLEQQYHRKANSVQIIAVSKTKTVADMQAAYVAGISHFAENYLQEALTKMQHLTDYDIEWHYIGRIQSNKAAIIAKQFSWVQSLENLKIAMLLNDNRPNDLPPLNCLVQVNIDEESTKSGVRVDNLFALVEQIVLLPHLRLRGLMAIPMPQIEMGEQRHAFRQLYELYKELQQKGYPMEVLSMGMSDDFEAAIAEGSTMIRIGTRLFGPRNAK
jgi:pyridoxal phosphate enzyme (YggS family)